MSEGPEPQIRVFAKIEKAPDLEVHVRELSFLEDDVVVVELRDYVPSRKRYGRGYWLTRPSSRLVADVLLAYDQNPEQARQASYGEDVP